MATGPPSATVPSPAAFPAPGQTLPVVDGVHVPVIEPQAGLATVPFHPPADVAATRTHGPAPQTQQHACRCNPGGRNLIVCIDGTSNQFSEKNTNVVELYSRLVKDETQLTFYNSGIGTYATPSWKSLGYYAQQILNKLDLAFALRFERIIISAYAWLSDNYQPGDRIFLFGFSRGAYQVRALSAMIDILGIIHKGNDDQIPFAYELYAAGQGLGPLTQRSSDGPVSPSSPAASAPPPSQAAPASPAAVPFSSSVPGPSAVPTSAPAISQSTPPAPTTAAALPPIPSPEAGGHPGASDRPDRRSSPISLMARVRRILRHVFRVPSAPSVDIRGMQQRFKSAFSRDAKVHFVGVWDTVSSVGIARSKTLPGTTDGMKHTCYFRHALAIHECRVKFLPEYVNGGLGPAKKGPFREESNAAMNAPQSHAGPSGLKEQLPRPEEPRTNSRPASKEVWFSGSHSDIGGGATNNPNLDRFGPSLRWMSFEARVAGVRFMRDPQRYADSASDHTHSLTPVWRILEILPFKHLTYQSVEGTTRMPHFGSQRVFQSDQRLYWGVSVADKAKFGLDGMETEADPYTDAQTFLNHLNAALAKPDEQLGSVSKDELSSLRESLRSLLHSVAGQQSLRGVDPDSDIVGKLLAVLDIRIGARDELRDVVSSALFGLVFGFDERDGLNTCCDPQQAAAMFFDGLDQRISSAESLDKHQKDMLRVLKSTDNGRAALRKHSERASGALRRIVGFPVSRTTDLFDAVASILAIEGVSIPLGMNSGALDPTKCDILALGCGLLHILADRPSSDTLADLDVREKEMLKLLRRVDRTAIGPAFDELTERMLPRLQSLLRVYTLVMSNPGEEGPAQSNAQAVIRDLRNIYDGFSIFTSPGTSEIRRLHEILQPGSKDIEWTVPQILGHRDAVSTVLFLNDTRIASASWDGTICIWDILTGDKVSPPLGGHADRINCLAACQSPYIVTGSNDRSCVLWNWETGQEYRRFPPLDQRVSAVACDPSGVKVVAATASGTVYLLDFMDPQPIPAPQRFPDINMRGSVGCARFSPKNPSLLALAYESGHVVLWDLATWRHWPLKHPCAVGAVAFSPDGQSLAAACADATVIVTRVAEIRVDRVIQTDGEPVWPLAYSPDGRYLAGAAGDGIHLWDAQNGQKVGMPLRGHRGAIGSVAWSPDGSRIASGANDKTVHLWDRVPLARRESGA